MHTKIPFDEIVTLAYGINGDWYHVGCGIMYRASKKDAEGLKNYLAALNSVVYIKGCPRKVARSLRDINAIISDQSEQRDMSLYQQNLKILD